VHKPHHHAKVADLGGVRCVESDIECGGTGTQQCSAIKTVEFI